MKKRIIIGLLGGSIIVILTQITLTIFNSWYFIHLARTLSVEEFGQQIKNPSSLSNGITWAGRLIRYGSYIAAGFFCAYQVRRKGWFYGGLVGVVITLTTYLLLAIIAIYIITLPDNKLARDYHLASQIKQQQIDSLTRYLPQKAFGVVIVVGLTSLGGIFFDQKLKKSKKNNN